MQRTFKQPEGEQNCLWVFN